MVSFKLAQRLASLTNRSIDEVALMIEWGWSYHEGVNCTPEWIPPTN